MGVAALRIRVSGLHRLPPSARKPRAIAAVCARALRAAGGEPRGEINIVVVDRRRMLSLNRRYLKHGHDTDVIAFSYDQAQVLPPTDLRPSPRGRAAGFPFGDIFISAHQARRQARQMSHPVLTEVLTLALHGTLHLLGYDDSTPRQKAEMFRLQGKLLHG